VTEFVCRDFFSCPFRCSFDVFAPDRRARQFLKQLVAFLETGHGNDGNGRAGESGSQGKVLDSEMLIARTEAVASTRTVKIGMLESQRAVHALEQFGPAFGGGRYTATAVRDGRARFLGSVGIQRSSIRSGREAVWANCCSW
jgi:hypothetical protein